MDLVRRLRIPYDWALEVGTLAEVFRNAAPRAICQSELCENYDHKHQELSARDADKGLNKMAVDIAKILLPRMAAEGIKLDCGLFDTLLSTYLRQGRGHASASTRRTRRSTGLLFRDTRRKRR